MKVAKTLATLRLGGRDALTEVARDLGHELPRNRLRTLAAFVEGIAGIEAQSNEFEKGFLAAIRAVTDAYCFAIAPGQELDEALRVASSRSGWLPILTAIADGTFRPSALAEVTRLHLPQVSKALKEMEEAGLVERFGPGSGEDGRSRPVRTTLLAEQVLLRARSGLPHIPPEMLVQSIVRTLGLLVHAGRMQRSELQEQLATLFGSSAEQLAATLLTCGTEHQLLKLVEDDTIASQVDSKERTALELVFEQAFREGAQPSIDALVEKISRAPIEEVFLRTEELRDLWELATRKTRLGELVPKFTTMKGLELEIEEWKGKSYAVVYESGALLSTDLREHATLTQQLISQAQQRLCFVLPERQRSQPHGFETIELAELS